MLSLCSIVVCLKEEKWSCGFDQHCGIDLTLVVVLI